MNDLQRLGALANAPVNTSTIMPYLVPVDENKANVPALRSNDILNRMLTNSIKMCIASYYQGQIIPLTEQLIREWALTAAEIQLIMDENLSQCITMTSLKEHEKDGFIYYSVHNMLPFFNSMIPFYKPFQKILQNKFGETFYLVVPERHTALIFDQSQVQRYPEIMRDDVHLTYDCSAQYLSKELIQVSSEGSFAVYV